MTGLGIGLGPEPGLRLGPGLGLGLGPAVYVAASGVNGSVVIDMATWIEVGVKRWMGVTM